MNNLYFLFWQPEYYRQSTLSSITLESLEDNTRSATLEVLWRNGEKRHNMKNNGQDDTRCQSFAHAEFGVLECISSKFQEHRVGWSCTEVSHKKSELTHKNWLQVLDDLNGLVLLHYTFLTMLKDRKHSVKYKHPESSNLILFWRRRPLLVRIEKWKLL